MKIIESLEWRYACKKFDDTKKLTEEQVMALKKAFNLTATSYGLQPLKLLVIQSDELKSKIFPHAYYQPQVTTCSHLLVICIESDFGPDAVDVKFDLERELRGTSGQQGAPARTPFLLRL